MNESKLLNLKRLLRNEVAIEIVSLLSIHSWRSGNDVIIVLELDGEEISKTKVNIEGYSCV